MKIKKKTNNKGHRLFVKIWGTESVLIHSHRLFSLKSKNNTEQRCRQPLVWKTKLCLPLADSINHYTGTAQKSLRVSRNLTVRTRKNTRWTRVTSEKRDQWASRRAGTSRDSGPKNIYSSVTVNGRGSWFLCESEWKLHEFQSTSRERAKKNDGHTCRDAVK